MKRPFKVRWFSPHWNDYVGKSFAYEDRAIALAHERYAEGCWEVLVWRHDDTGDTILLRLTEPVD